MQPRNGTPPGLPVRLGRRSVASDPGKAMRRVPNHWRRILAHTQQGRVSWRDRSGSGVGLWSSGSSCDSLPQRTDAAVRCVHCATPSVTTGMGVFLGECAFFLVNGRCAWCGFAVTRRGQRDFSRAEIRFWWQQPVSVAVVGGSKGDTTNYCAREMLRSGVEDCKLLSAFRSSTVSLPVWHRRLSPLFEEGDAALPKAATTHECVSVGQMAPEKDERTTPYLDCSLRTIAGTRVIEEGVWRA